jgi:hypothetical protein
VSRLRHLTTEQVFMVRHRYLKGGAEFRALFDGMTVDDVLQEVDNAVGQAAVRDDRGLPGATHQRAPARSGGDDHAAPAGVVADLVITLTEEDK